MPLPYKALGKDLEQLEHYFLLENCYSREGKLVLSLGHSDYSKQLYLEQCSDKDSQISPRFMERGRVGLVVLKVGILHHPFICQALLCFPGTEVSQCVLKCNCVLHRLHM